MILKHFYDAKMKTQLKLLSYRSDARRCSDWK